MASRLKINLRLHFFSTVIMSSALILVVGIVCFTQNLQTVLTVWGESLEMNAYLSEDVSEVQKNEVLSFLKQEDKIQKVEYIDQKTALARFQKQMLGYAPELAQENDLLKAIPASFTVNLDPHLAADQHLSFMQYLSERLTSFAGIEEVSYGQDWVKSYAGILATVHWVSLATIAMIIIGVLFVAANVIRSSLYQRRPEIEILELLGAEKQFIRTPFLIEGAVLGASSSVIALAVGYGLFQVLLSNMQHQLNLLQMSHLIQYMSVTNILILIVAATLLSVMTAYLCLRDLNSGWAASKRLNA